MPDSQPNPIDTAIDARRRQLGLRWKDLYDRSGVAQETLRKLRQGMRDEAVRTTDTEAKVEDALGWARGSIQAVREGGEPQTGAGQTSGFNAPPQQDYPEFVGNDPLRRHIWDGPGSEEERKSAILAVVEEQLRRVKAELEQHTGASASELGKLTEQRRKAEESDRNEGRRA